VFYITEGFWPLNTTLFVVDFKGNDPQFVSYLMRTIDYRAHSDKSSLPGVNRNYLHAIPVLRPPLPEQCAIARILGSLDEKIELGRRMNATLEEMARSLFRSWFVDFDPVRAKAEGREPAGMDAATAALFPDRFEESELGEIPKGWRVAALPDVVRLNPQRRLSAGRHAPYLEMANVPTNGPRATGWETRAFSSGMRFTNGDVLLARITPCLENGKTAYVDFLGEAQVGWGSTEYIVMRSVEPLPDTFAYFLARSLDFRSFAIRNMTGTSGRQRVPVGCFDSYRLAIPTGAVAQQFGAAARPLMKIIKYNDEQSRTLALIRDALLPKLLSGEIRVREAEHELEAVL